MSLTESAAGEGPARRRRGEVLENALLDAAWGELIDHGYDALTIEAVAARADTSRAVVYRRWATKPELVQAAIVHGMRPGLQPIPDTGSLRSDLLEAAKRVNANSARLGIALMARLGTYYVESGASFADLRSSILGGKSSGLESMLQRAVERGEIDPAKLTPTIEQLPFDLIRYQILTTFKPVPPEYVAEILDTIFLPLVRPDSPRVE
jgi:AcrR family transcriptional regulator